MNKTVIILLAAGNASRMGQPKQLLSLGQQSLLERMICESAAVVGKQIVLVLGAYQELIKEKIAAENVQIVVNKDWKKGMGSSIKTGLATALQHNPDCENVIFSVVDQPFVSAELFQQLLSVKRDSKKKIVACSYADTIGVPVLFDKSYFGLLATLKDSEGAKKILVAQSSDVETIAFPQGAIDIDTPEDYTKFINNNKE